MWWSITFRISTVGSMATDWVYDSLFGKFIPPAVEGFLYLRAVGMAAKPVWMGSRRRGAVLGFLPRGGAVLLFGHPEDSGYMARIAFILERIFRASGLGKILH
jgi:ferrous iron transport protein B